VALTVLADVTARVAGEYRERLVPAVDRVWRDEIAAIARDLRGWVRRVADEGADWIPKYFELAFGLREDDQERDPRSVPEPVGIDGRFTLRGSIDLVEEHVTSGTLRVTDHKTGKNRSTPTLVIGGGAVLQPVLYSMVVERMTDKPVGEGRLSYCTTAGGFTEKVIPLTPDNRRLGVEVLEIVDRAVETGFLAAAPAEGACRWCDFRPVCGPNEEERIARKPGDPLRDLAALRSRP
jgi:ATP-dependent helicase/nuclease subunit B